MLFFPDCSTVIRGAPRHVAGAPRFVAGARGAPRLVVRTSSCSEGRQECPPRAWYSPEFDSSKFTLHMLSDTPGGIQWLKYILLMRCNASHHLSDGKHEILRQRVQGSVRAIRAVRNTRVFLKETWVVADVAFLSLLIRSLQIQSLSPPHRSIQVYLWTFSLIPSKWISEYTPLYLSSTFRNSLYHHHEVYL